MAVHAGMRVLGLSIVTDLCLPRRPEAGEHRGNPRHRRRSRAETAEDRAGRAGPGSQRTKLKKSLGPGLLAGLMNIVHELIEELARRPSDARQQSLRHDRRQRLFPGRYLNLVLPDRDGGFPFLGRALQLCRQDQSGYARGTGRFQLDLHHGRVFRYDRQSQFFERLTCLTRYERGHFAPAIGSEGLKVNHECGDAGQQRIEIGRLLCRRLGRLRLLAFAFFRRRIGRPVLPDMGLDGIGPLSPSPSARRGNRRRGSCRVAIRVFGEGLRTVPGRGNILVGVWRRRLSRSSSGLLFRLLRFRLRRLRRRRNRELLRLFERRRRWRLRDRGPVAGLLRRH